MPSHIQTHIIVRIVTQCVRLKIILSLVSLKNYYSSTDMKQLLLLCLLCLLTACNSDVPQPPQDIPTTDSEKSASLENDVSDEPPAAASSLETIPDTSNADSSTPINQNISSESKANAAKLSSTQRQELLAVDKNNSQGIDVKIVVPTYVPPGFKVKNLTVDDDERFGPFYIITYHNDVGNCFEISGASGGFGAGVEDYEIITVESKALGTVDLGLTQFDSLTNQPAIGFDQFSVKGVIPSQQEYSFRSSEKGECSVITLSEAAKIVESLDYLNP